MASKINESPKRKKRRLVTFQDKWLEDNDFKERLQKSDDLNANCVYCKTEFTIKYEGIGAIKTQRVKQS